jgi:signal transduction histidine kinase
MVVCQQRPEFSMNDREVSLTCCPQMKSALIVPITFGGSIAGMITISEVREHSRRNFTLTDIKLAQDIALIAAQTFSRDTNVQTDHRLTERIRILERNQRVSEVFADLPRRLATPLTSIMARSDLILQSIADSDGMEAQNLRVIKKQAERITSCIQAVTELRHNEFVISHAAKRFNVTEDDAVTVNEAADTDRWPEP